jgi:hypothetical protein
MPSLYLTNQEVSFLLPLIRDNVRRLDTCVAKIKRDKPEDSSIVEMSEKAESLEGVGTKLQTALWQANYSGRG